MSYAVVVLLLFVFGCSNTFLLFTLNFGQILHFISGQVYTWGHRLVTPRRVVIARNLKKSGSTTLKFHRMVRLHVVAVAAGMVHSMALTEDGSLFYWVSSDPDLRCQQVLFSQCLVEFFLSLQVKHVTYFSSLFFFLPIL